MATIIKLFLAVYALLALVSCGPSQYKTLTKENPDAFVEAIKAGVYVVSNANKEMEIILVKKNGPADKAGIKTGDIIVSVDNVKVKDRFALFETIYERKKPGDSALVTLKRNGKLLNTSIQFSSTYFLKDQYILTKEVTKEKPLNLAIIISDISNVYIQGERLEQWKRGMTSLIIGALETSYLEFFKYEKNASIIDRQNIESALKELAFQKTGLISEESQIKVGNMLGATHLLIISYSRFSHSTSKANDVEVHRLIDINSGKTMANITLKHLVDLEKEITPIQQDLIKYHEELSIIFPIEKEAIEAFSKVTGPNYTNDDKLYSSLSNTVLPKYEDFLRELGQIQPSLPEVKNIHKIYVEGAMLQLGAFKMIKEGLDRQDVTLINKANTILEQGKEKIGEWQKRINTLR